MAQGPGSCAGFRFEVVQEGDATERCPAYWPAIRRGLQLSLVLLVGIPMLVVEGVFTLLSILLLVWIGVVLIAALIWLQNHVLF